MDAEMTDSEALEISYGQLCVFQSCLVRPYNDWTPQHVAQGFSWRPGSVSFGTLEEVGALALRVSMGVEFDESTSLAERVVVVPFSVGTSGAVEVGSIQGGIEVSLPSGEYELIFEHGHGDRAVMWANLYFRAVGTPVEPRVIRADGELSPPAVLLMTAEPG